jgi:hypothetical protein
MLVRPGHDDRIDALYFAQPNILSRRQINLQPLAYHLGEERGLAMK